MLTVKLHVLLNKVIWEFHADCEVTCITEQAGWNCSLSDLYCRVSSSYLGQDSDNPKWFCCGFSLALNAVALLVRSVMP